MKGILPKARHGTPRVRNRSPYVAANSFAEPWPANKLLTKKTRLQATTFKVSIT
jgi:hypothetical protein